MKPGQGCCKTFKKHYQALQLPIVEAVITKHLGDFTAYSKTLLLKNATLPQQLILDLQR